LAYSHRQRERGIHRYPNRVGTGLTKLPHVRKKHHTGNRQIQSSLGPTMELVTETEIGSDATS